MKYEDEVICLLSLPANQYCLSSCGSSGEVCDWVQNTGALEYHGINCRARDEMPSRYY